MAEEIKCDKCGDNYDAERQTQTIRHQHGFCLTNPAPRSKKRGSSLSLKEQWLADRAKDRKREESQ